MGVVHTTDGWKTVAHITGVVAWIVSVGDLFISCCAEKGDEEDVLGLKDSKDSKGKAASPTSLTKFGKSSTPTETTSGGTAGTTASAGSADAGGGAVVGTAPPQMTGSFAAQSTTN